MPERMRPARTKSLVVVLSLWALPFGCGGSKQSTEAKPNADALAQVDDVVITVADFQRRINEQSPYARARLKAPEKQKELLDDVVRAELFAKEAQRRGLQNDPEFVRTVKDMLAQRLLKDELAKVRLDQVSDKTCKDYFEAHLTGFNQPEQVQVAWILVNDAATAKKVLADPRVRAGAGDENFRRLVAEYSQDAASKDHSGLLPFFADDNKALPRELVTASFSIANNSDVSPPVKVPQGVAIIKLVGRKKAIVRQFDEVKQQIRNMVYRDQQQDRKVAFEKELREKSQVKIDESKLASVKIEGAVDLPATALPPGNASPPKNLGLGAP